VIVPFLRDIAVALDQDSLAAALETGWIRVSLALALIWIFVGVNIRGLKAYTRTLVPMMFIMFALGAIVIIAGFSFDHGDFTSAILEQESRSIVAMPDAEWKWMAFLSAAALMFSSFIGFDSIAQAGGEARNPSRNLPLAITLAIVVVGSFYFLFAAAIYHAVPWWFVAEEALNKDISAPGLLSYLLPAGLAVAILVGAAIALINDLPAMLLSVSRLMFAWAADGIFPPGVARVHARFHTPHLALIISGFISSIGVLGSHFAGDFFLGIDIMVTAMLINFLLMCLTLLNLPRANPALAGKVTTLRNRRAQVFVGVAGTAMLTGFLAIHIWKDLSANVSAWYFHSTWVWLVVMALGSVVFFTRRTALLKSGVDLKARFSQLPD
jgi:APA family basic amino acid/polyamine antiporter